MAVLEQFTAVIPDGEVVVAINYSPTTKIINNLVVENNTGQAEGQVKRNVHAKIFLDGEMIAEHAGDETYVFKGFPAVTAVTVTVDGESYDQPPDNFRYEFSVL